MEVLNLTDSFVCRICFQSDDCLMIHPCACRGSLSYVHEDCIKTWILVKFPALFDASCEVCKHTFKIAAKTYTEWKFPCDFRERCKFLVKFSVLLVTLGFLVVASVVIYDYFVNFEDRMVYSILILIFCGLLGVLNVFYLFRVFLSSFLVTRVKSWSILNCQSHLKSQLKVKPTF
jgi:succinate dehydrogenase hydrophobic anchor subunit